MGGFGGWYVHFACSIDSNAACIERRLWSILRAVKTTKKTTKKPTTPVEPTKPQGVPAHAKYDAASQEWELGELDAKGKPVGEWRYWWRTTGHLCCVALYEDGGRKNTYTRFHPDGTYSVKGVERDGHAVPGEVIYYQKSKHPTTELAISGPEYKKVFRVEETYIRKGLSKWKNFDAKGRRIEMDGTLIPMLDEGEYAKNFGELGLPAVLASLVAFQNDVGAEMYSEGFALQTDNKGLFQGFCAPNGKPVAAKANEKRFLEALLPIAAATGTGSVYGAWNDGKARKVEDMPIVVFGDEGGVHIVAENLEGLLAIVAADVEPMVDWDGVSYFKTPDHEPRPEIAAYRTWLADNVGIKAAPKPDAIVKKAQKRYGEAFKKWMNSFA